VGAPGHREVVVVGGVWEGAEEHATGHFSTTKNLGVGSPDLDLDLDPALDLEICMD
jgi:hypothetical protein